MTTTDKAGSQQWTADQVWALVDPTLAALIVYGPLQLFSLSEVRRRLCQLCHHLYADNICVKALPLQLGFYMAFIKW